VTLAAARDRAHEVFAAADLRGIDELYVRARIERYGGAVFATSELR
jgi:hypothetical protein